MRPATEPKLTKRERKNDRGFNVMQKHSIKNGKDLASVAGATYRGATPIYAKIQNPKTGMDEMVLVTKGIPFVRVA